MLAFRKARYSPDDGKSIEAGDWLTHSLANLGQREEAEPLFRRVLAYRTRETGQDHDSTLYLRRQLASTLLELDRQHEAQAELATLVDLHERRALDGDSEHITARELFADVLERCGEANQLSNTGSAYARMPHAR